MVAPSSARPTRAVKPLRAFVERARRGAARRLGRRCAGRLLAYDCALCMRANVDRMICADCDDELPRLPAVCPVCAMPSATGGRCGACLQRAPAFDRARAALPYGFPVDRVLHRLKFDARLPLAAALAQWLAAAVEPLRGDVEVVVPMPLARGRLRERGFNQSAEIGRRVAAQLALPFDAFALRRIRETRPQTELAPAARRANVRDAFAASPALIGRRVAIVDDVMTTGASLDEAARVAKRAGALRVEAWVVARAFGAPPAADA